MKRHNSSLEHPGLCYISRSNEASRCLWSSRYSVSYPSFPQLWKTLLKIVLFCSNLLIFLYLFVLLSVARQDDRECLGTGPVPG